jgi:hypothetical protein
VKQAALTQPDPEDPCAANYGDYAMVQSTEITQRKWIKVDQLTPDMAGQKVRGDKGRLVIACVCVEGGGFLWGWCAGWLEREGDVVGQWWRRMEGAGGGVCNSLSAQR